ncbi:membrane protein [Natrinema salaciae]|uniref:Membrane protein n=2 Tax=Natrinema salaciae TaxID=1186196 RepID=A0A1H8ZCT0_9EURY|nr:membrane protein [Natrinema salaciae]
MRDSSLTGLVHDVAAVARERQLGVPAAGLASHAFDTVLTWVYVGSRWLLLGAVLDAVLADLVGPETEWVPL